MTDATMLAEDAQRKIKSLAKRVEAHESRLTALECVSLRERLAVAERERDDWKCRAEAHVVEGEK
jgi:hypothetical protein